MGNVIDLRGNTLLVSRIVADEILADVVGSNGWAVVAAGQFTTVGGDATESVTATGVLATDIAFAVIESDGTNDSVLLTTAAASNAVTLIFNEDPGADILVNWMVLRAAS